MSTIIWAVPVLSDIQDIPVLNNPAPQNHRSLAVRLATNAQHHCLIESKQAENQPHLVFISSLSKTFPRLKSPDCNQDQSINKFLEWFTEKINRKEFSLAVFQIQNRNI
jgi:hypothetical protein